ncbi:uncharacterized protein LOC100371217 [Saccoglossus kowalevskii]|uniref:Polyglutamine-binding protein 1-like n=1 Tax=Saccoglossus kowalevskii TaxID=10224 RepID=A0ABM0GSN5_SACKO|nr:PREDICTED: polyglutamine-binding protein 1-like [Saccoglossus kowalevskii]
MPLPPALVARLKQRGLIKQDSEDPHEEIIAEDYSDISTPIFPQKPSEKITEEPKKKDALEGVCPNRSNKWHTCSDYCEKRWVKRRKKKATKEVSEEIPSGWVKVADENTGHEYYWNMETDQVSWLPPTDPKAKITLPESKLKEQASKKVTIEADNDDEEESGHVEPVIVYETCWKCGKKINSTTGICRMCERGSKGGPIRDSDRKEKGRSAPYFNIQRGQHKRKAESEELDPMDPSAYSDTPRFFTEGRGQSGGGPTGSSKPSGEKGDVPALVGNPRVSPGFYSRIFLISKSVGVASSPRPQSAEQSAKTGDPAATPVVGLSEPTSRRMVSTQPRQGGLSGARAVDVQDPHVNLKFRVQSTTQAITALLWRKVAWYLETGTPLVPTTLSLTLITDALPQDGAVI